MARHDFFSRFGLRLRRKVMSESSDDEIEGGVVYVSRKARRPEDAAAAQAHLGARSDKALLGHHPLKGSDDPSDAAAAERVDMEDEHAKRAALPCDDDREEDAAAAQSAWEARQAARKASGKRMVWE